MANRAIRSKDAIRPAFMQELLTLLFVLVAVPLSLIFGGYCFFWSLIAIHEVGHVVACKIVGFEWNLLVIGPLKIENDAGKTRLSWSGQTYDGRVCSDFGVHNASKTRNLIVLLGGTSMNLFTGALSLVAIPHVPLDLSYLKYLLVLFAFGSLVMVAINGLPIKIGEEVSDGFMAKELIRGNAAWAYTEKRDLAAGQASYDALMLLYRFREAGQRPRDWDADVVRASVAHGGKDLSSAIAAYLAFYWAEDCGDVISAGRYISRAVQIMETVELSFRPYLPLDGAYYVAFYQRDPTAGRALFMKALSLLPESDQEKAGFQCGLLRAQAAILLAEGRPTEALAKANEAVSFLTDEHCGDQYMLERLICACDKEADTKKPSEG